MASVTASSSCELAVPTLNRHDDRRIRHLEADVFVAESRATLVQGGIEMGASSCRRLQRA